MSIADLSRMGRRIGLELLAAGLAAAAILAIFFVAPTERTMGLAQRIVYIHVAVAWVGLAAMFATAACGLGYLLRRQMVWDHAALAAAELGWLGSGLTLVTGSLWAHEAWGTWWTWDPRLTTALVLWAVYSGYLLLRAGLEDPHRRARVAAVAAILGTMDIPFVVMATRWFRGIHPRAPEMEPAMRAVLLLTVAGFTAWTVLLWVRRRAQLQAECQLAQLQAEAEARRSIAPRQPEQAGTIQGRAALRPGRTNDEIQMTKE